MRNAETILGIIRERGRQKLPLEDIYRQLYRNRCGLSEWPPAVARPSSSAKSATRKFIVNVRRGVSLRHRSLESRLEIERLTSGLEGGCWKSAQLSNSLAAYPTLTHGSE